MILCIDAGNTRVKFGLHSGDDWVFRDAIVRETLASPEQLSEAIASRLEQPPQRIAACSVAGAALAAAITSLGDRWHIPVDWLRSEASAHGVRNAYASPEQLGNDRWAALIAARAQHAEACVVVMAGTAITVDALDETGCFRGGLILPGLTLMRNALAANTAQLPVAQGRFHAFPDNTDDAIVSGCLAAAAGAVGHMRTQLGAVPCILSGGDAERLRPLLAEPIFLVPDLVLDGLARIGVSKLP